MTSGRFLFSHFVSEIRFLAKISLKYLLSKFFVFTKNKFSIYDFSFLLNSYFSQKFLSFYCAISPDSPLPTHALSTSDQSTRSV